MLCGRLYYIVLFGFARAAKLDSLDSNERSTSQSWSVTVGYRADVSLVEAGSFMRSEPSARSDGNTASLLEVDVGLNHVQTPGCAYNDWQPWSSCTKSCGGGMKSRIRIPSSANCSQYNGDADCNTQDCAVDCTWQDWGTWSACSTSCGHAGVVTRVRIEDMRENGGRRCHGSGMETKSCPSAVACGPTPRPGPIQPGLDMRATGVHGIITMVTSNVSLLTEDTRAVPPLVHAITDLATVPDSEVKVGLKPAGANLELWFTIDIASSSSTAESKQIADAIMERLTPKTMMEVANAIQYHLKQSSLNCVVSVASMKLHISYVYEPSLPSTTRPHMVAKAMVTQEPTPLPTPPNGGQLSGRGSLLVAAVVAALLGAIL